MIRCLLLLILLLAGQAFGQSVMMPGPGLVVASSAGVISLDSTNNWSQTVGVTGGGASVTYTLGAAPAAGSMVVAAVLVDNSATINAPTDNFGDSGGGAWTSAVGPLTSSFLSTRIQIWYRLVGTGASGTVITETPTGSFPAIKLMAGQYNKTSGTWAIDGTPCTGQGSGGTVSCDTPTSTITVSDGSLLVEFVMNYSTNDPTPSGGFTNRSTSNATFRVAAVADQIKSGAGAVTPGYTGGSVTGWNIIAAAWKVN